MPMFSHHEYVTEEVGGNRLLDSADNVYTCCHMAIRLYFSLRNFLFPSWLGFLSSHCFFSVACYSSKLESFFEVRLPMSGKKKKREYDLAGRRTHSGVWREVVFGMDLAHCKLAFVRRWDNFTKTYPQEGKDL